MESKLSQNKLDHVNEVWHRSRQPKLALKKVEKWMKKQKDYPRLEVLSLCSIGAVQGGRLLIGRLPASPRLSALRLPAFRRQQRAV